MAYIPGSVRVAGFIAPTDSTDTYPTHDDLYGKGGYKIVADITARDAITPGRRKEGMLVKVIDAGSGTPAVYTLVGGITNSDWVIQLFGSASVSVAQYTLTGTDITNKYADLGVTVTATAEAVLLVAGAPGLNRGTDFTVNGSGRVTWNGLGLDGILESGDNFTLIYK